MPLYVYGVLAASAQAPNGAGIAGEPLELVRAGELAALVSPVPNAELTMGREALDAHARVLEAAHERDTVLPMRFGVVMTDEDEVAVELLDRHRAELEHQLSGLAGTVELKLRAIYQEQPVLREIVAENEDVARLRATLQGADEQATYYGQIRLGEMVAAALERKRDRDANAILDALQPLALATDVAPPPHERVVLAASFLVRRPGMDAFDEAVNRIGEAQAGRMRFTYTGPLPPHSFVTLAEEV